MVADGFLEGAAEQYRNNVALTQGEREISCREMLERAGSHYECSRCRAVNLLPSSRQMLSQSTFRRPLLISAESLLLRKGYIPCRRERSWFLSAVL
jgi:hypothetical protein